MVTKGFLLGNLAQASVNTLYGISGVVGGIGLHDVNPAAFGAIRCWQCAALLLVPALLKLLRQRPCRYDSALKALFSDGPMCCLLCCFLFQSEFFYMLGLRLAGTISASLWQPTQPIFTIVLASLLGIERLTARRVAGLVLTCGGCAAMVLGAASHVSAPTQGGASELGGHACLLINCLGTPLFILTSRPLLRRGYRPLSLTTIAFAGNSVLFAAAVALVSMAPPLMELICSRSESGECAPMWAFPPVAWAAVSYISLMGTAVPFVLQMVAIQNLHPSLVSAYYALQPIAATACTYVVLAATPPPHLGLRPARPSDLGGVFVLLGLGLVVHQDYVREQRLASSKASSSQELPTLGATAVGSGIDGKRSAGIAATAEQQAKSKGRANAYVPAVLVQDSSSAEERGNVALLTSRADVESTARHKHEDHMP